MYKALKYRGPEIRDLDELSFTINHPKEIILKAISQKAKLYRYNPLKKKSGGIRTTYIVTEPIKTIQTSVKDIIISEVSFPHYLMGGIKDTDNPRGYIKDAELHLGAKMIISLDIKNFFPSISIQGNFNIWRFFFNFPNYISKILSELTSFNNGLPQGSVTSDRIGNLIFWDKEFLLANEFASKGIVYSRYIDDISVSSKNKLSNSNTKDVISKITNMVKSKGLTLNRKKIKIQRDSNHLYIHNIKINPKTLTLKKSERNIISSLVRDLDQKSKSIISWREIEEDHIKLNGKVGLLKYFHKKQGSELQRILMIIKSRYL